MTEDQTQTLKDYLSTFFDISCDYEKAHSSPFYTKDERNALEDMLDRQEEAIINYVKGLSKC